MLSFSFKVSINYLRWNLNIFEDVQNKHKKNVKITNKNSATEFDPTSSRPKALYLAVARVETLIAKRPKVVYLAVARVAPVIAKGSILPNSLKACRYNSEGRNICFVWRSFV